MKRPLDMRGELQRKEAQSSQSDREGNSGGQDHWLVVLAVGGERSESEMELPHPLATSDQ